MHKLFFAPPTLIHSVVFHAARPQWQRYDETR